VSEISASSVDQGPAGLVLQASFEDVDSLILTVEEVVAAGVDPAAIEVRSSQPIEKPLPLPSKKSRVLWFALAGALLGGTAAFLMASLTALMYPLPTGGKPILSGPPIAIVTYEGTALGLILCTVLGVLLEGRLVRKSSAGPLDRQLSDGLYLLNLMSGAGVAGADLEEKLLVRSREICAARASDTWTAQSSSARQNDSVPPGDPPAVGDSM
jgi:hypothetical protein